MTKPKSITKKNVSAQSAIVQFAAQINRKVRDRFVARCENEEISVRQAVESLLEAVNSGEIPLRLPTQVQVDRLLSNVETRVQDNPALIAELETWLSKKAQPEEVSAEPIREDELSSTPEPESTPGSVEVLQTRPMLRPGQVSALTAAQNGK